MIPQKITEEEKKERQEHADMIGKFIAESMGDKGNKEFGWLMYNQLLKSCYANNTNAEYLETLKNITVEVEGIAPKDQIEGMLAVQMIATHHAVMDCYRIAAKSQMIDTKNLVFNSANKLTRTYAMQMEALNRYRGKGQQKMTVEHVHINSGGQAIIGNVTKNNSLREGVKPKGEILENEQ